MAKFCRACGTALQEGGKVCPKCGAAIGAPAQQPKQESSVDWKALWNTVVTKTKEICGKIAAGTKVICGKVAEAVKNADWDKIADTYKKCIRFIVIAMTVLSLVLFVVHTFSLYDVTMTASYGGETQSASGPIQELYEDDEFVAVMVVNILCGILFLAVALVGAVVAMKSNGLGAVLAKVPKLGEMDANKLYTLFCWAGVGVTLLYLLLNVSVGSGELYGITYKLSAPAIDWWALVLFGLLAVANLVLMKKGTAEATPAVEAAE